jgi:hypothetical protein
VSFNRLKALPASMSGLTGLAVLSLAYNPLGCFPEVLCSLTNLRELNIDQTGEWPMWPMFDQSNVTLAVLVPVAAPIQQHLQSPADSCANSAVSNYTDKLLLL